MYILIKILLLALTNLFINKLIGQPLTVEALNWNAIIWLTTLWSLNNIEIGVDN